MERVTCRRCGLLFDAPASTLAVGGPPASRNLALAGRRASVRGEQGEATANGASRVHWMLSAFACAEMDEASHVPIRPLPVLVARLALPMSVLARYTIEHGTFTDDSQANWHTARHTALV
jgi:hypothetical protein